MEDETPWMQLASLALFKLFNDWQAQGFVMPSELWKTAETPPTPGFGQAPPTAKPTKPPVAKKVITIIR